MNFAGLLTPDNVNSQFSQIQFMLSMALAKLNVATLVEIVNVTNDGGVAAVGFVDVKPLVSQVTAVGEPIPHQTVFNLPYFRLQGGESAVIMDPKKGDIGLAVFADRDLSVIKKTKAAGLPGSFRQHSFADGLYIGGFLNGVPTQFVQFSDDGIAIVSPTKIQLTAPDIALSAEGGIALNATGAIDLSSASLTHNGKNIGATHTHGGVTTGGGNTGVPT